MIFINQIREKIGVMFGSPETTTGGRALKFYSSVRIDIRRIGQIKDGDIARSGRGPRPPWSRTRSRRPSARSSSTSCSIKESTKLGELLDIGVENGVLRRSGTWLSYGDTRLGQGRERAREFLDENPEVKDSLREQILVTHRPHEAWRSPP